MIALDTSVVLDLFSEDLRLSSPAKRYFEKVKDHGGIISAVLLTELLFHVARRQGAQVAVETAAFIEDYPLLSIANVTPEIASLAGMLRNKYYHRTKQDLSSLDVIQLATAIQCGAESFVTSDNGFSGIEELPIDIVKDISL